MKTPTIYFNIDNLLHYESLLASDMITLCVILVILGVLTLFSLQGLSGSLRTEFRTGDPFMRTQNAKVNLVATRINNTNELAALGYTEDPGPRRYLFVYDNEEMEFRSAIRAGIYASDGVIVTRNGFRGIVIKAENISGDPVKISNIHFDFNAPALNAYGTDKIHIMWNKPNFTYDFYGRNARTTFTDYDSKNGE